MSIFLMLTCHLVFFPLFAELELSKQIESYSLANLLRWVYVTVTLEKDERVICHKPKVTHPWNSTTLLCIWWRLNAKGS